MRLNHLACVLLAALATSQAMAAADCSIKSVPQPLPIRPTALPPLSGELPSASRQLGAPDGVLAYSSDEMQAVDRVLMRLHDEECRPAPAAASAQPGYVPQTKWDNTPYRFNAGGNGKKFSAAEFSAWMEAKGIHVSKGAPQPMPAAAAAPATPPTQTPGNN